MTIEKLTIMNKNTGQQVTMEKEELVKKTLAAVAELRAWLNKYNSPLNIYIEQTTQEPKETATEDH